MRRGLAVALLAVLATAAAASAAAAPVVPLRSQHAIRVRIPRYAYVPARVPTGFHYYRWSTTLVPRTLQVAFRDRAGRELVFVASAQHGPCAAGREQTFQLDGNKVYWSHTATGQQAWRCVGNVRLAVTTTLPPTRFAGSGLGIVASSGHVVR